ncbi:MAG: SH3 domain-containing protein [candidate division KSB1 bacterium]|nr:SH3 domain-containing protein [candidate division KSB1 bacterium]MDZ7273379.1 SH3 domain-containing protein [candidate division KSB1 bacterium]MDZ7288041.1 SH3 domain-containing protein [candidate division KSB1 bacterium]MDZ7300107.1 SH3 domain-containing protein [candidate division KSB1 bacterium]MDZ7308932.1 SH3 domain-containing protein [candidate division KSB1 bacterium]
MRDPATTLYEMPSITSRRIVTLSAGDTVHILQNRGLWLQLVTRDDHKGWMFLGETAERGKRPRPPVPVTAPMPPVEGGVSLQFGKFGSGLTGAVSLSYRSLARLESEATLQYAAGKATSFYLLHMKARSLQPLALGGEAVLLVGAGVLRSTAREASVTRPSTALTISYGMGVQRRLGGNHWLRAEMRRCTAFNQPGVTHYLEFLAGFTRRLAWSRL